MNLNNKRIIALVLTIVILASILNIENIRFNSDNISNRGVNNYNECYFIRDAINISEEKTKNDLNNLLLIRSSNKFVYNYFNKHIIGCINSVTNLYKLKYTAAIDDLYDIYRDSVFVVSYIHKKDGKKRTFAYLEGKTELIKRL